jgi:hypothetical protein
LNPKWHVTDGGQVFSQRKLSVIEMIAEASVAREVVLQSDHGTDDHDGTPSIENALPILTFHVLTMTESPSSGFSFASRPRLAGVFGNQQSRDGDDQDLCIKGHRPIARIIGVTGDTFRIGRRTSSADLPKPRYSWAARQIGANRARISLKLFVRDRTRSDDAHVALEYVEQLRQFVQA